MGGRTQGNGLGDSHGNGQGNGQGNGWKILIGLSVLCAALVFLGGFLHRHALDSAIADRQAKSVAFVNVKLADAVHGFHLDKPLKAAEAARLTKKLDVPAGTDVRLFSMAGVPVYGSPGSGSFPADAEGIQAAAAGDQGRVVDGADLRVYTPVRGQGQKPVAIAAVMSNYTQLRNDASGPLDAVRLPVVGLGIVFLIAGLLLMLQATKGTGSIAKPVARDAPKDAAKAAPPAPSKRRVTGFDPIPVTVATDEVYAEVEGPMSAPEKPAAAVADAAKPRFGLRLGSKKGSAQVETPEEAAPPAKAKRVLFGRKGDAGVAENAAAPPAGKTASALDREVAIRQALEDQLEQLRTRIQMQEVETNTATQELLAQLEAASRRAEEAETRLRDASAGVATVPAPASGPAPQTSPDADARIQQMERELAEARSITADAITRADALQRQVDEAAAPIPVSDPAAAAKLEEAVGQLADAQQRATAAEQRASAAEQRAASVESVRDELEVRVAQLGTKAGDLEQRATELETSLNEANAGGDAVRAEIATLTAALTVANSRVDELEGAPAPPPPSNEEDKAEIARLRGELANHMERAQVAEERVTTLEADVLAAEQGVRALPVDDAGSGSDEMTAPEREPVEPPRAEAPATATPEPQPPFMGVEAASPAHGPSAVDTFEAAATQVDPRPETPEGVAQRVEAPEPEFAQASEPDPEPQPQFSDTESAAADTQPETPEGVSDVVAAEIREPEPTPAPAAPTVAWRAPTPTTSEIAASTNGNVVPPAPSDDARYDDIWTAAFAPPQQADEHQAAEPQADEHQIAELQAAARQAAEPEASVPQPSEPQQMTEPTRPEPPPASAPESTPEVAAEDRPAPPEDEVSAEDDMWSLRARLAEAAARKHPPRTGT